MTADLQLVFFRPLPVRVVDDPHRQPEHAALDRLQNAERLLVGNSSGSAHGGVDAGRVTAPSLADETSAAYFASTPLS